MANMSAKNTSSMEEDANLLEFLDNSRRSHKNNSESLHKIMKIQKTPPKRLPGPSPVFSSLIQCVEAALSKNEPLTMSDWPYSKADLFHFIGILDKIDTKLHEVYLEYFEMIDKQQSSTPLSLSAVPDLSGVALTSPPIEPSSASLQTNVDPGVALELEADLKGIAKKQPVVDASKDYRQVKQIPTDEETFLCSIFNFLVLLFDNGTNRNLFNSFEYLNVLLYTKQSRLLIHVLRFMLRPSSRINTLHRNLKQTFKQSINLKRVLELTMSSTHLQTFLFNRQSDSFVKESAKLCNVESWSDALEMKLLATSVYFYLSGSDTNEILSSDLQLIPSLIDILSLSSSEQQESSRLKIASLQTIEAISSFKTKRADLIGQLNLNSSASVPLFLLTRSLSTIEQESEESTLKYTVDIVDALLNLFSTFASFPNGAQIFCNNESVHVLLAISATNFHRLVSKSVSLLSSMIYSNSTFFTSTFILCTIKGMEAIQFFAERVHSLVEAALSNLKYNADISESIILKSFMKFILYAMQSYSGTDRVRNLIESSLIGSIHSILSRTEVFSLPVISIAMNFVSTFINNEPTSFSLLHEKDIPGTFIRMISEKSFTSAEVLSAIPGVISALCLNANGLALVLESNPFPKIFSIFSSADHLRALHDEDLSSYIGNSFDELLRHQPKLKDLVFRVVYDELGRILTLSEDAGPWENAKLHSSTACGSEVLMVDKDIKARNGKDILQILYIESIARFLEGLFQHQPHCKDFLKEHPDLIERLLSSFVMKNLPYDFATNWPTTYTMSHVFRIMADVDTVAVMNSFFGLIEKALQKNESLLSTKLEASVLLPLIDFPADQQEKSNELFIHLKELHFILAAFCDVFSSPIFANSKSNAQIIDGFMERGAAVLKGFMAFYRWCAWESVSIRYGVPEKWITRRESNTGLSETNSTAILKNTDGMILDELRKKIVDVATADLAKKAESRKILDPDDPRIRNLKAFKHLLTHSTGFIVPLFQGLLKNLLNRRSDDKQRKNAVGISNVVAESLFENLAYPRVSSLSLSSDNALSSNEWINSAKKRFQYFHIVSGLIHTCLTDERNYGSLLTVVAWSFVQKGGLEKIFSAIDFLLPEVRFVKKILDFIPESEALQRKKTSDLVDRGSRALDGFLQALLLLVDHKPLTQSNHTSYLNFRGFGSLSNEFGFSPEDFLIKIRGKVLTKIVSWIPLSNNVDATSTSILIDFPFMTTADAPMKTLLHLLLHIIKAQGEGDRALKKETSKKRKTLESNVVVSRGTDPDNVQTLVEAGFERDAVISALNMSQGQFVDGNDSHMDEEEPITDDGDEDYEDVDEDEDDDVSMSSHDEEETPLPSVSDDDFNILYQLRSELSDNLPKIVSFIIQNCPDSVFEWKDILSYTLQNSDENAAEKFITNLDLPKITACLSDIESSSKARSQVQIHLLSLLANEASLQHRICSALEVHIPSIVECVVHNFNKIRSEDDLKNEMDWLSMLILILEAYSTVSEEPRVETLKHGSPEDIKASENAALKKYMNPLDIEAKRSLVVASMHVVKTTADKLLLQSSVRLISRLTRDFEAASELLKTDHLINLLTISKKEGMFAGQTAFITLIVRHVMESRVVLRCLMQKELAFWFTKPKDRNSDVASLLRTFSAMALRDPSVFLESVENFLKITGSPLTHNPPISIIKTVGSEKDTQVAHKFAVDFTGILKEEISKSEASLKIVSHLVGEIFSLKALLASSSHSSSEKVNVAVSLINSQATTSQNDKMIKQSPEEISNLHFKRCFYLQCLTVIFSTFPPCKIALLKLQSRRKSLGKENTSKTAKSLINHLIFDLLPYPRVIIKHEKSSYTEQRESINESEWALNLLVQICSGDWSEDEKPSGTTTPVYSSQQDTSEYQELRKLVVDAISRSFKEALALDSMDMKLKFGRYQALANLVHKILPNVDPIAYQSTDPLANPSARALLEKNMVVLLTNVLSDLEMSAEHYDAVASSIILPLESLTKIANKISRANNALTTPKELPQKPSLLDSVSAEQASSPIQIADAFLRDSALGMYSNDINVMETDTDVTEDDSEIDQDEDEDGGDDSDGMADLGDYTDMSEQDSEDNEMDQEYSSDDVDDMEIVVRAAPFPDDENDDEHSHSSGSAEEDDYDDEDPPHWLDPVGDDTIDYDGEFPEDEDEDLEDEEIADDIEEDDDGNDDEDEDEQMDEGDDDHEDNFDEDAQADLDEGDEGEDDFIEISTNRHGGPLMLTDLFHDIGDGDMEMSAFTGSSGFRDGSRNYRRRQPNWGGDLHILGDVIEPPVLYNPGGNTGRGHQTRTLNEPSLTDEILPNPLLDRNYRRNANDSQTISSQLPAPAQSTPMFEPFNNADSVVNSAAGNALQMLERLLNLNGQQNFHIELTAESNNGTVFSGTANITSSGTNFREIGRGTDKLWLESKAIYGAVAAEKALALHNSVLNRLIPAALKEEEERKKAAEEQTKSDHLAEYEAPKAEHKDEEQKVVEEEQRSVVESPAHMEVEPQPTISNPEQQISINGITIDLTNTGIDPMFLEALPDEMRAEVLAQHLREQGDLSLTTIFPNEISTGFLMALPADIQDEVLQFRAIERQSRSTLGTGSFIQGSNDIALTLNSILGIPIPRNILQVSSQQQQPNVARAGISEPENSARAALSTTIKKINVPQREPAQLIDRSSAINLLRLLLAPQQLKNSRLEMLLGNLMENSNTRSDVVNLLLGLIQESIYDIKSPLELMALDKTPASSSKGKEPLTPKATKKTSLIQSVFGLSWVSATSSENISATVIQRCLKALSDLVVRHDSIAKYFLTESDNSVVYKLSRRASTRFGKLKGKPVPVKYPLIVLLSLLDVPVILKNPSFMDMLTWLLSAVTRPLLIASGKPPAKPTSSLPPPPAPEPPAAGEDIA